LKVGEVTVAAELVRIEFERFLANPEEAFELVRRTGSPVLVVRDGDTYRLQLDASAGLWSDHDPEAARRGLRAGIGALREVDVEELLSDLHDQRGQDSRGRPA
jgi:hypothetical protein